MIKKHILIIFGLFALIILTVLLTAVVVDSGTEEVNYLGMIDQDIQKQYQPLYKERLSSEKIMDEYHETIYLVSYFMAVEEHYELNYYVARVKQTKDGWDVDTYKVYFRGI